MEHKSLSFIGLSSDYAIEHTADILQTYEKDVDKALFDITDDNCTRLHETLIYENIIQPLIRKFNEMKKLYNVICFKITNLYSENYLNALEFYQLPKNISSKTHNTDDIKELIIKIYSIIAIVKQALEHLKKLRYNFEKNIDKNIDIGYTIQSTYGDKLAHNIKQVYESDRCQEDKTNVLFEDDLQEPFNVEDGRANIPRPCGRKELDFTYNNTASKIKTTGRKQRKELTAEEIELRKQKRREMDRLKKSEKRKAEREAKLRSSLDNEIEIELEQHNLSSLTSMLDEE